MRFFCENACAKQAIKCKFEFIVFAKGTNIVSTNFAFFTIGHGFGGRFRGLVSNFVYIAQGKLRKRRKRRRSPERSLEKQEVFEKYLHQVYT